MAGKQNDSFQHASESARFVSDTADAVTGGLVFIEDRLRGLPDKFECRFPVPDGTASDEQLVFARSGKEWALLFEWKVPSAFGDDLLTVENKPVLQCDLETRLRCAVVLKDLVTNILAEYERRRELADRALDSINDSMRMLGMRKEGR